LRDLWIKLIRSQFHDSICGTVTDHVALNVEAEFNEVIETARHMVYHHMSFLSRILKDSRESILVFNPSPYRGRFLIEISDPRGIISEGYRSVDTGESLAPLQKIDHDHPLGFEKYIYVAEVPPLSIVKHRLSIEPAEVQGPLEAGDSFIRSKRLAIELTDSGEIRIRDLASGEHLVIEGLIEYRDRGDVYSYEMESPQHVASYKASDHRLLYRGPVKASIRSSLKPSRDEGCSYSPGIGDAFAICSAYSNIDRVDLDIGFLNMSRDHVVRLRIKRSGNEEIYRDLAFLIDKPALWKTMFLGSSSASESSNSFLRAGLSIRKARSL
jgi:hypothetical protein